MPRVRLASLTTLLLAVGAGRAAAQQAATDTAAIRATAEQVARKWLAIVDQARYDESWNQASAAFRAAVTQSDWELAVRSARGPLEPFGARRLIGSRYFTQLPNAPPGQYMVLQFSTVVAGGRMVIETVTPMKDTDGTWRVGGYFVRPQ